MEGSRRLRANEDVRRFLSNYAERAQTPSRRRVLDAFLRLATTEGFNAVSMRMLGRELNVKAPSIYSHFPNGKDEIVAESLRWYIRGFAHEILASTDESTSPQDYWEALVRTHLRRQLQLPESDMWDLLVATDRVGCFLSDDLRSEINVWMGLHEGMYRAAAEDMGYRVSVKTIRMVLTLLDGAGRWSGWNGDAGELVRLGDQTVTLTRSVLDVASESRTSA